FAGRQGRHYLGSTFFYQNFLFFPTTNAIIKGRLIMSAQQKNAQVLCFGAAFRMLSDRSLPHVRRQKQILLQHPADIFSNYNRPI
ncbi:MAG: hypothetical protein PUK49_06785, partial [Oscillospiraceae bacterium]|nr:hypothetical protein [Oscillospiraceae bacterium]